MSSVQLFAGKKFFILQRVPSRARFIDDVERNGGRVIKLEKDADYLIADHMRRDAPAASISYTFIEEAMREGRIPDESKHQAGRSTATQVGSASGNLARPGKNTRTPYTAEDDRMLWEWVKRHEAQGASIKGNEIYKELEAKNPRHTFQSWRDRYIKYLSIKPPIGAINSGPLTPPMEPATSESPRPTSRAETQAQVPETRANRVTTANDTASQSLAKKSAMLSEEHLDALLEEAEAIEEIPRSRWDGAWNAWASKYGLYTGPEWADLYNTVARPKYLASVSKDAEAPGKDDADSELARLINDTSKPKSMAQKLAEAKGAKQQASKSNISAVPIRPDAQVDSAEGPSSAFQTQVELDVSDMNSSRKRQRPHKAWTPFKLPRTTASTVRAESSMMAATNDEGATTPRRTGPGSSNANSERDMSITSTARKIIPDGPGAALTTENLAKMRASQEERVRRAIDLPQDDENEDRTDFAERLASMLPQHHPMLHRAALRQTNEPVEIAETDEAASGPEEDEVSNVSSEELGSPSEDTPRVALEKRGEPRATSMSTPKARRAPNGGGRASKSLHRSSSEINAALAAAQLHEEASQEARRSIQSSGDKNGMARRVTGSRNAFADYTSFGGRRSGIDLALSSSPPIPPLDMFDDRGEAVSQTVELDLSFPDLRSEAFTHMSSQSSEAIAPDIEAIVKERNLSTEDLRQLDTQAIYNQETQNIDDEIPGFDDLLPPSSPIFRRASRRQSAYIQNNSRSPTPIPSQNEVDVDEYIDRKVKEGADEDQVMAALLATCMQVDLAEVALRFLSKGLNLPETVTGIWTESDDAALLSKDNQKIMAVDVKHGWMEIRRRNEFLAQLGE